MFMLAYIINNKGHYEIIIIEVVSYWVNNTSGIMSQEQLLIFNSTKVFLLYIECNKWPLILLAMSVYKISLHNPIT